MMDLIEQFAIDCAGQKEWDFPKDPKSYTFTPDELAKFANLIVKECVGVSLESSHRNDDMGAIIARQIEKHFGVE